MSVALSRPLEVIFHSSPKTSARAPAAVRGASGSRLLWPHLHGTARATAGRGLLCIQQGRDQFLRCLRHHIEVALRSLDLAQLKSYEIFYDLVRVGL